MRIALSGAAHRWVAQMPTSLAGTRLLGERIGDALHDAAELETTIRRERAG